MIITFFKTHFAGRNTLEKCTYSNLYFVFAFKEFIINYFSTIKSLLHTCFFSFISLARYALFGFGSSVHGDFCIVICIVLF